MRSPRVVRSAYHRVATRRHGALPAHRAATRLSAYVYGNILVMAVVVAASPSSVGNGTAALSVAATALTTFLAHIFADWVAAGTVQEARLDARHELRDAVPIASSALLPTFALALAWLDVISAGPAQTLAGAVVTLRIATIPVVTERLRGHGPSIRLVIAGILLAVLAGVVVSVKVYLTH